VNYSGPLHLATIIGFSILVAAASLAMLEDVKTAEWLTIPVTFLYCNLAEYLGHRGPMHHKTRFLGGIFKRHTVEHHSFFTDEAISFDSPQDYRAVLFPPILLVFFFGLFAERGIPVRLHRNPLLPELRAVPLFLPRGPEFATRPPAGHTSLTQESCRASQQGADDELQLQYHLPDLRPAVRHVVSGE
jgi:hypothetical protein